MRSADVARNHGARLGVWNQTYNMAVLGIFLALGGLLLSGCQSAAQSPKKEPAQVKAPPQPPLAEQAKPQPPAEQPKPADEPKAAPQPASATTPEEISLFDG
ncbi:MAG: hypothetical protein ACM3VT_08850, partial [Solirubrobacterales bacterium]